MFRLPWWSLSAFKDKLVLYRDAATAPCVKEALLEHHVQHRRSLDAHIDKFVNQHRDGFAREIGKLMRKTAPDKETSIQAFEGGLASLLGGLYRVFEPAIERSRQDVDTPTALAQLRSSCGGRLHELEREITVPGRAT